MTASLALKILYPSGFDTDYLDRYNGTERSVVYQTSVAERGRLVVIARWIDAAARHRALIACLDVLIYQADNA